jgi:hypothetical protein
MNKNSNTNKFVSFFSFSIFYDIWQRYSSLKEPDKALVNTFILFLLIFVLAGVVCVVKFPENTAAIVLASVFSSTAVSTIYSIFDRLSLLTPVEGRLEKILGDMQLSITTLENDAKSRATKNEELVEKFIGVTKQMVSYDESNISRQMFGFDSIVGRKPVRKSGGIDFKKRDVLLKVLSRAKKGDQIVCLTSFIDNDSADAIQRATNSGAHLRLMMMLPREDAEVVRARWKDFYDGFHENCAAFVAYIAPRAQRIAAIRRRIENLNTIGSVHGTFQLRFYTKSLNFPLVVHSLASVSNAASDEYAYTGFYANMNAEDMPYIVWHGGQFEVIDKFKKMFEAKWEGCREMTDL